MSGWERLNSVEREAYPLPKTSDYLHRYRGYAGSRTRSRLLGAGVRRRQPAPVMVMGELPQSTSPSVTTMAEDLAPELIQRHVPPCVATLPGRSFWSIPWTSAPQGDG